MERERVEKEVKKKALQHVCSSAMLAPIMAKYPRSKDIVNAWCQMGIEECGWGSDEARRRTAEFCRRFPSDDYPQWLHARVLQAAGEIALAEKVLVRGWRRNGNPQTQLWLYRDYARIAEHRRDWVEAGTRWSEVTRLFGASADGPLGEARCLLQAEARANARSKSKDALAIEPTNEHALRQYAKLAAEDGDWAQASTIWRTFRLHFDTRPEGYLRGAEANFRLGRAEEAWRLLDAVATLFPRDLKAQAERAQIIEFAGGTAVHPANT